MVVTRFTVSVNAASYKVGSAFSVIETDEYRQRTALPRKKHAETIGSLR